MKIIIIANIFGFGNLVFNFIGTQMKTKNQILLCNGISNFMSIIQYFILGAFTGAISCIIALTRNIVFYLYKNKIPFYVLVIYLLSIFIFNFFFLEGVVSAIPVITTTIYGICLYQSNVRILKGGTVIVDSISILFDLYNKAYVSMVNCIFSTIGALIGYIRYINYEKVRNARK